MTPGHEGTSDPRTWPVKRATSYGGVVVRDGPDGPEVALIRPASTDDRQVWALPKGTPEPGEDGEETALREVREETGLDAEIVQPLDAITYWFVWAPEQVRYRKTVHFFLMRHTAGEPTPDAVEVAEVRFVPLATAALKASYTSERKVLKAAAKLVASW
jgi:ADP-ribose pyrophosphatase YjhB (NUDIX family)